MTTCESLCRLQLLALDTNVIGCPAPVPVLRANDVVQIVWGIDAILGAQKTRLWGKRGENV